MGYLCIPRCDGVVAVYREYDPVSGQWLVPIWYYCESPVSERVCVRVPPMRRFIIALLEFNSVLEVLKKHVPVGRLKLEQKDFRGYWLLFSYDDELFRELRSRYGYYVNVLVRV
jgi:hypothetical protein